MPSQVLPWFGSSSEGNNRDFFYCHHVFLGVKMMTDSELSAAPRQINCYHANVNYGNVWEYMQVYVKTVSVEHK